MKLWLILLSRLSCKSYWTIPLDPTSSTCRGMRSKMLVSEECIASQALKATKAIRGACKPVHNSTSNQTSTRTIRRTPSFLLATMELLPANKSMESILFLELQEQLHMNKHQLDLATYRFWEIMLIIKTVVRACTLPTCIRIHRPRKPWLVIPRPLE